MSFVIIQLQISLMDAHLIVKLNPDGNVLHSHHVIYFVVIRILTLMKHVISDQT